MTKPTPNPKMSQAQRLNSLFWEVARIQSTQSSHDPPGKVGPPALLYVPTFEALLPFMAEYHLFGRAFPAKPVMECERDLASLFSQQLIRDGVIDWIASDEGADVLVFYLTPVQRQNHLTWTMAKAWLRAGGVPRRSDGTLNPVVENVIAWFMHAFGTHRVFGTAFPTRVAGDQYDRIEQHLNALLEHAKRHLQEERDHPV